MLCFTVTSWNVLMRVMWPHAQLATDQVAKALKVQRGAVIQGIAPNSAAAKAGLLTTRRGLTGIVPGEAPSPFCAAVLLLKIVEQLCHIQKALSYLMSCHCTYDAAMLKAMF